MLLSFRNDGGESSTADVEEVGGVVSLVGVL